MFVDSKFLYRVLSARFVTQLLVILDLTKSTNFHCLCTADSFFLLELTVQSHWDVLCSRLVMGLPPLFCWLESFCGKQSLLLKMGSIPS